MYRKILCYSSNHILTSVGTQYEGPDHVEIPKIVFLQYLGQISMDLRERERENQTTFTTARSQIGFHDHQLIDYDAQIPCIKFYPICSIYTHVMKGSKMGKQTNFMT